MKIEFDFDLPADEAKQLAAMINVSVEQLPEILPRYAKAALEEYVEMINANKNFTRATDIREYRLYLLIKYVYKTTYPDPADISKLFQTTSSQSASLLNSVMYKFSYELEEITLQVISELLQNAKEDKDTKGKLKGYKVTEPNDTIIKHINNVLQNLDGTRPAIKKDNDGISLYYVKVSSYQKLLEYINSKGNGGNNG